MTFSIRFTATTPSSAQKQLRDAYAPNAVKALVELALAGIFPQPMPSGAVSARADRDADGNMTASEVSKRWEISGNAALPRFIGVRVEACGHIADGTWNRSDLSHFVVEPLFE